MRQQRVAEARPRFRLKSVHRLVECQFTDFSRKPWRALASRCSVVLLLSLSTLGHARLSLDPVDAAAGQTVTVTLSLANDSALPSLSASIAYDLNRVRVLAYRAAGRNGTAPAPEGDDGQFLNLSIASAISAGDGPIVEIDFQVRDNQPAGIIPLSLNAAIPADSGYIRVPATGPPGLSLTLSRANVLEADPPVIGTVTLSNVASLDPTHVTLHSANSARAVLPSSVEIPSSANSASFEIQLPNDLQFGPDVDVLLTATADFGNDSVTLHVRDDDAPADPALVIGAASPGTAVGLLTNQVTISDVEIAESASVTFSVSAGQGARAELDYSWALDGQQIANSASFVFAPGYDRVAHPANSANHQLICTVADSATAVWNLRITDSDRLPPAPRVSVSPTATADPLVANVEVPADPDGDTILGLDITWTSPNGVIIPGDTVSPDLTLPGETWRLRAHARTAPYGVELPGTKAELDVTISELSFVLELSPGWNLISLPFSPLGHYPELATALRWENGFQSAREFTAGIGYFVHSQVSVAVVIAGSEALSPPAYLDGWNLVGPIGGPQPLPGAWALIDGRYRAVDELCPGRGYWWYNSN